jgi:hypothetical protein
LLFGWREKFGWPKKETTTRKGARSSGVAIPSWPSGVGLKGPHHLKITLSDRHDRNMTKQPGKVYVGIGGWTYEPWRGVFYPKGLPHAQELPYAAEHLTSIEVNGTFYRTQTPKTFHSWANQVPEGFVF